MRTRTSASVFACVRAWVCACVRAWVCACVRTRAGVHACVWRERVCVRRERVYVRAGGWAYVRACVRVRLKQLPISAATMAMEFSLKGEQ